MAQRFPLVLDSSGVIEQLQNGDTVWQSVLSSPIDDTLELLFADRTTLYSDATSGLVLQTSAEGDLFIITDAAEEISFKFRSTGILVLPEVPNAVPVLGALLFNGTDLFIGGQ